jgi:hypothetical protein
MKILSFCLRITILASIAVLSVTSCKKDEPVPDTATISGTVTIDNADLWATWKDSGEVQLAIFPEFNLASPGSGWGDIPDGYFGTGVPGGRFALGAPSGSETIPYSAGISGFTYSITVDPGTYSALALGFRHNLISNPSKKTATLGVYWNHPNEVSHGIVILPYFNDPAPSVITVKKGDKVTLDFKADFGFVQVWPFH